MASHKTLRVGLWLSFLLDAFIIVGIALKASRVGISGLLAWFRHLHLTAVSAASGQATYRLEPDYRFTILYTALILGAFALSFLLLRSHLKSRRVANR